MILTKNTFFPIVKINNCNIEIDGRNFYDQPINDSIKQYDEVRKISTGKGDDYTTGCLLDFDYFEKNYRIIAVDLSKQKALDADSRAIQQIIFTGEIKAIVADTFSYSHSHFHSHSHLSLQIIIMIIMIIITNNTYKWLNILK